MKYTFTVTNNDDEVLFHAEAPTLELLEEKIGAYQRHIAEGYRPVEPTIFLK